MEICNGAMESALKMAQSGCNFSATVAFSSLLKCLWYLFVYRVHKSWAIDYTAVMQKVDILETDGLFQLSGIGE